MSSSFRKRVALTRPLIILFCAILIGGALVSGGCRRVKPASSWTFSGLTNAPWFVAVSEARKIPGGGIAGPDMLVSSGQTVLVGQGDIIVNLALFKGASLDAMRPFIEVSPASAGYHDAEWDDSYRLQVRWNADDSDQRSDKMTFRMKKGAPLGNQVTLAKDFVLTLERRVEPRFTVVEVGNESVAIPYGEYLSKYTLAPGKHTFRVTFTKDMDRKSVETTMSRGLNGVSPEFKWESDRLVTVMADLAAKPSSLVAYTITAEQAVDRDGMPVWANQALALAVTPPLNVVAVPVAGLQAGEARPLMTLQPGHIPAAISDDGQKVIAFEWPWGDEEPGDGPLDLNPWLYTDGGKTRLDLTRTIGRAHWAGFKKDNQLWYTARGVLYEQTDPQGNLAFGIADAQVKNAGFPAGWAISGNGLFVVSLVPPADYTPEYDVGKPVRLDLVMARVFPAGVQKIAAFTEMPSETYFYGRLSLGMAMNIDGSVLVYADQSGPEAKMVVVDVATGTRTTVMPIARICPMVMSRDGSHVLARSKDDRWVIVTVADGTQLAVDDDIVTTEQGVRAKFSPDGRYLAFTTGQPGQETSAKVVDVSSGAELDLGTGVFVGWSPDGQTVYTARP